MPFKSQAQRRKFAELLVEGKISNETFEEFRPFEAPNSLEAESTHTELWVGAHMH